MRDAGGGTGIVRLRHAASALTVLTGLYLLTGCAGGGPGNAPAAGSNGARAPSTERGPLDRSKRSSAGEAPPSRTADQPRSTFALDVDTASYSHARQSLRAGQLPDPSSIRPEEFVNSFRQDYRQPPGAGFTVTADGAVLPDRPGTRLLRVGLQTRGETAANRRDAALTFAVDVSGSMAEPGKLQLVKDALHQALGQLRPNDRIAIVSFNAEARVLRAMTPVRDRGAIGRAIDELGAGGGTNLGAGVRTAYRVARDGFRVGATNRVVLLSDGLANQGDTEAAPILRTVSHQAGKGISLLCVGVGGDYGDAMMEQLADHGNGLARYVADRDEARRVFVDDLPANLDVRARDAKAQVTFDPEQVRTYRLIGFDDRRLADEDFRNAAVDGGWIGPGHSVTALYEVRLAPGAAGRVGEARVRWHDPDTGRVTEAASEISVGDLAAPLSAGSARLRVDYAAAYFAEALRGGRYAEKVDLPRLAATARAVSRRTEDPDVRELAQLIGVADTLR